MSNSGAKAALKGYRLQTLYILVEILESNNPNITFQPEGIEDLAIYKNNILSRVIQVKARDQNLSLSCFDPHKKDSFFHRASNLLQKHENLSIEIISFGNIGDEILRAISGDERSTTSIKKKLTSHGVNEKIFDSVFNQKNCQKVSEEILFNKVKKTLGGSIVAGNPTNAISLLTAWLYHASENKTKITKKNLIDKISSVGKYLSEREAHHAEWFKSIKPLNDADCTNIDKQMTKLSEEFYKGISSRFIHIKAGLDIDRPNQINKIEQAFKDGNQTVIIHGASGQGKSTLAYRYLYQFIPDDWCFRITFIKDRMHAESISLAIADHLSVFKADLYLYIDVSPNESEWTNLVKSLLNQDNIKILISIREEDLARHSISDVELGYPKAILLQFDQSEAKTIYQNLIDKNVTNNYPSFNDAWAKFGSGGSLLEFIYFLTQTESLYERLKYQVKRLQKEVREGTLESAALEILLCCAIATSYESKVEIKKLVSCIQLSDPPSIFSLFEEEYLIRCSSDNQYVESLHPLRSKLLAEILSDPTFSPRINATLQVLPCILESDLENFLHYTLIENPKEYSQIYQCLFKLNINSWQGFVGISKTLIWYGIYKYVEINKSTINQSIKFAGNKGWKLFLNPDVAKISNVDHTQAILESFAKSSPENFNQACILREQVSSSNIIFEGLKEWLNQNKTTFNKPTNEIEWLSMNEVIFWSGWLNTPLLSNSFSWVLEKGTIEGIPNIYCLSGFTLALYFYDGQLYNDFIKINQAEIETIFQRQTNTIWLEQKENNPVAHYIVPNYLTDKTNDGTTIESLNNETVFRAEILRNLYPNMQKFGGKGYGHQYISFDASDKPSILKSSLLIKKLVRINATYLNLVDYAYRPTNWNIYVDNIMSDRKKFVEGLTCLNKALVTYFKNKKSERILGRKINDGYWDSLSKINMNSSILPKTAVDPWGYTSEAIEDNKKEHGSKNSTPIEASVMLSEYKNHIKSWGSYLNSLTNFITQSKQVFNADGNYTVTPQSVYLTVIDLNDAVCNLKDFQREFRNKFHNIVDDSILSKLEENETEKIQKVWSLWYQFAYNQNVYWKTSPDIKALAITRNTRTKIIKDIEKELIHSSGSQWKGNLLSKSYPYEDKPSLWIRMDLESISSLDGAYSEMLEVLTKAIRPIEYKDLKYFVLTNNWHRIIIVPLIKGVTLNNLAYRILTSSFIGNDPIISDDNIWEKIPLPLPKYIVDHLNLKSQTKTEIDDLFNAINKIYEIVLHVMKFVDVTPNLNELGREILGEYLILFNGKLTYNVSEAYNHISGLRETHQTNESDLLDILDLCEESIFPYGKTSESHQNINLGDSKEWCLIIENAINELNFLKWRMV